MWKLYLLDEMFYNNSNNLLVEFQILSFSVTGKTRILPLHIHYIPNDCSLSVIFVKAKKVKFNLEQAMKAQGAIYDDLKGSSLISIVYSLPDLHTASFWHSCKLSSAFLVWFSHLHILLHARLLKFLCSVAYLTTSIFLIALSSLICSALLFRISSLLFYLSGHFRNMWDSLSPPLPPHA